MLVFQDVLVHFLLLFTNYLFYLGRGIILDYFFTILKQYLFHYFSFIQVILLFKFFKVKIKSLIYVLLACYLATFFRLIIDHNFVTSLLGSFFVGFIISKRLSYSSERILLSGFFSCFTSFSGFIFFLYKIINQGDWIKFIILFNLIIIINLFTMYFGFWISRKITQISYNNTVTLTRNYIYE